MSLVIPDHLFLGFRRLFTVVYIGWRLFGTSLALSHASRIITSIFLQNGSDPDFFPVVSWSLTTFIMFSMIVSWIKNLSLSRRRRFLVVFSRMILAISSAIFFFYLTSGSASFLTFSDAMHVSFRLFSTWTLVRYSSSSISLRPRVSHFYSSPSDWSNGFSLSETLTSPMAAGLSIFVT